MIAQLRGRLVDKRPNQVLVDVGGVGYLVHVPLSTFYTLAEPGREVALRPVSFPRGRPSARDTQSQYARQARRYAETLSLEQVGGRLKEIYARLS